MKNKIFTAVLGSLMVFGFASTALAADGYLPAAQCNVPPDHGIYDVLTNQLTGCITAAAWDAAEAEIDARNGQNLPTITPGTNLVDEQGVTYDKACPAFFSYNCVDLTRTDAYRDSMRSMARELIAFGFTAKTAPRFAGWINSVR